MALNLWSHPPLAWNPSTFKWTANRSAMDCMFYASHCYTCSHAHTTCTMTILTLYFSLVLFAFSSLWLLLDTQVTLHNHPIWYRKIYFFFTWTHHKSCEASRHRSILSSTIYLSAVKKLLYLPLGFNTAFLTAPVDVLGLSWEDITKHIRLPKCIKCEKFVEVMDCTSADYGIPHTDSPAFRWEDAVCHVACLRSYLP